MAHTPHAHPRLLDAIAADRWAIQEDALARIVSIAQGFGEGPEAVAAKLGRPLENTRSVIRRGSVAVVPVTGPIFRYANLLTQVSGATSIEALATDFATAVADPSVSAIVLEIDSPGGQVAGVSEFADQVRQANAVKPVVAYVSDLGASAAYWIAAAAGQVIARDTARLGSIGVVLRTLTGAKANELKFISSQSPRKHAAPDSDLGRDQLQTEVDALAEVFIGAVAAYRGVSTDTVKSRFGQGGTFVGQAAVDAGLADALGSLESVIARLNGPSPRDNPMTAKTTTPLTRDTLAAEYPELLAAVLAEGREAGYQAGLTEGADRERARIRSIEEAALPGHDALVAQLKWDGKTSGPDAALAIVKAERQAIDQRRADFAANATQPVTHAASDDDLLARRAAAANPPPTEQPGAAWDGMIHH